MCETRKFVMAVLDWKQELLCDKIISDVVKMLLEWSEVYRYNVTKSIEGKGEIALFEQFLLFSKCFHNSFWFDLGLVRKKKSRLVRTKEVSLCCQQKLSLYM